MSKFFDFCDKHKKILFFVFVVIWVIVLLLPDFANNNDSPFLFSVFERAHSTVTHQNAFENSDPEILGAIDDANQFDLPFAVSSCVCVVLLLVSLIASTIMFILRRTPFFIVPLLFSLLSMLLSAPQAVVSADIMSFDISFKLNSAFYILLIIFFLYIVYLLLRRYYAPAKARILASLAEHQANRKPTKDERIAELERKVAELESKNKDEQ